MTGLQRSTVSPWSSIITRSTPWVLGCWGPMLMIMVSSPVGTSSTSSGRWGMRSTEPGSRRYSTPAVRWDGLDLLGALGRSRRSSLIGPAVLP